ncbi:MAG: Sapep family Mn(2+)-dependent dipeptidase [Ruminococcus sp.]|nr:Sapep family Mn(2+)-dependent dipeptidase [Ruminococcus sp.]
MELKQYFQEHKQEMVDFMRELISVRSVQNEPSEGFPFGKKPAKALNIMLDRCRNEGFAVENVENYVGTAVFNNAELKLGILCHLDVVPEGDGWTGDPYVLRYEPETDKLIGRGAIDDKGPSVAAFFALKAIKDLNIKLKSGVQLIFGTNEENGSADLAYYRRTHELPPCVFTPDGEYPVINGEKGMLRVYFTADAENLTISAGNVINAVPNKCSFNENISLKDGAKAVFGTVEGKSAHASTPEKGENAITKFLAEYSKEFNNELLLNLAELFPHNEFDGKSCGLGFSDEISGKMTCVLSMLNTENGKLKGGIDIRFPLDRTKDEIIKILKEKIESAGFEITSYEGAEPHITDENSPFVQTLLNVYERVTGEKGYCIAIGGGTYVHEIEGGVAFGAEFPNQDGNMHGADEFITLENLLKNAEIMAEAIIEICK